MLFEIAYQITAKFVSVPTGAGEDASKGLALHQTHKDLYAFPRQAGDHLLLRIYPGLNVAMSNFKANGSSLDLQFDAVFFFTCHAGIFGKFMILGSKRRPQRREGVPFMELQMTIWDKDGLLF